MRGRGRRRIGVADALPGGGEDHEDDAGEESGAERQVHEQLPRVGPGLREEAVLHVGVAERHREEHDRGEEGVDVVDEPDAQPPQILEDELAVVVVVVVAAGVVEHVEAAEGGHAVVELAVAAAEAVGEGEEDAGGGAEVEEEGGEELVRGVAGAVVGEGGGERLTDNQSIVILQ